MAEPDDEDDFPNDFDGLDFDGIPGLQAPTISGCTPEVSLSPATRNIDPANPVLSTPEDVENLDPAFLAAVDALEARALAASRPLLPVLDRPQGVPDHAQQPMELSPTNRKGKRKAEPGDTDVRAILGGYETELTCPICFDLLVGAQVANPCGHTYCGECGYGWLTQNKYPTCAVCRVRLASRKPLLPNFSVDNLVQQHLQALARSGHPEWQKKGYRTVELNKRLTSWKKMAASRAAKEKSKEAARLQRRQQRCYQFEEYLLIDDSVDDDEEHVMPRRTTRSRH